MTCIEAAFGGLEASVMLEKILLSITITLSLYLTAQSLDFHTTSTVPKVHQSAISEPPLGQWQ